jgi:hypothetical protein
VLHAGLPLVPLGWKVHVPTLPGSAHDTAHDPLQATLQQIPATQCPSMQSPSATQVLPSAHVGQLAPPQSTSVSVPSFAPFEQFEHAPLTQFGALAGHP